MSEPGETAQRIGQGMQSCGCMIVLIPLLVISLIVLYAVVASMFHG